MKRILIATDGSPAGEAAVAAGLQLAGEQGAAVVFLHVVEAIDVRVPSPRFGGLVAHPHAMPEPESDDALAHAAECAREHDVPFELRLVSGFDVETILATADEIDAELIAVGSNRRGAVATAFLGSVSKELLRRASRPVLVVHPAPTEVPAAV
jgi:nucleotide-binding universal stress UspA family protein